MAEPRLASPPYSYERVLAELQSVLGRRSAVMARLIARLGTGYRACFEGAANTRTDNAAAYADEVLKVARQSAKPEHELKALAR